MSQSLYAKFGYDENGNTTSRTIYGDEGTETVNFEYDVLNRLVKTIRGTEYTEYFYDNAGNRVIKSSSDGSLGLYLRHGTIAVAMDLATGDQSEEKGSINRYVLSGDLVAGRVTTTVNADSTTSSEKNFYHLDHLNSTKVVTDEAGEVVVNYTYRAFGEQLKRLDKSNNPTEDVGKYSYSGKELDEDINLYYFNARFYDATTGRFINVDPIQDGSNWYIYCSDNPLSYTDPTGLDPSYAGMDSNYYYSGNKTPYFGYSKKFAQTQTDLVGKDYIWGGNDPVKDGGVDCSGSILYGLKEMGYTLPDMTANEIVKKLTLPVEDKSFIEGDIRGLHAKGK